MRLLLITSDDDNSVDQILVVVPDDYNPKEVEKEAEDHLDGACSIEKDIDIGDEAKYAFSEYRMYVG